MTQRRRTPSRRLGPSRGMALPVVCAMLLMTGLLAMQCWRELAHNERRLQARLQQLQAQHAVREKSNP